VLAPPERPDAIPGPRRWEVDLEPLIRAPHGRRWRVHSDAVNEALVERWIPAIARGLALKTDLFDEAMGTGLVPRLEALGFGVVAIDVAPSVRAAAARHRSLGIVAADVRRLPFAEASFDVIVSNCVINLCPDKAAVLREVFRLLKPGGEFYYFSDVYADRRVPAAVRDDPVLYGECLGGALYWNDFLTLARAAGFADPRLVEDRPLAVTDPALAAKLGDIRFFSATWRLFRIDGLESACEDYGQAVVYRGTVPGQPSRFVLDKHHHIDSGRVFPVCGNTWRMLHDSRLRPHFDFIGDFTRHFGLFAGCGDTMPFDPVAAGTTTASTTERSGCC